MGAKTIEIMAAAGPMIEEVEGILWEIDNLRKEDMGEVPVVTFEVLNMTSEVSLDGSVQPGAILWFEVEERMNILDVLAAIARSIEEELRRRRNC